MRRAAWVAGTTISLAGALALITPVSQAQGEEGPRTSPVAAQEVALPAFPGASGFGSTTPGGRGGAVVQVTTLADSGAGSLRAALEESGPRIVVFRVAGAITLTSPIAVRDPYVTVAGQSAPGDGITVRGAPLLIRTHDVVLRHLRLRPGSSTPVNPEKLDGLTLLDTDRNEVHDVVIDHVSATWSVDENLGAWYGPRDITVQWSLLAEGLAHSTHLKDNGSCCDLHSMGALIGPGTRRLSLHHNVFAHNNGRNPHLLGGVQGELVNNLVFDWGYAATEIEPLRGRSRVDVVGNVFIPGETSYPAPRGITVFGPVRDARLYLSDNLGPRRPTGSEPEWDIAWLDRVERSEIRSGSRVAAGSGLVPQAASTLEATLLPGVGAARPARDAIDARIIASIVNRSSGLVDSPSQVGGYLTVAPATPPGDGDKDGMADGWELSVGLDPSDASDRNDDRDADGYTNVEEYLNSLAG
jgi:pectate lyase